MLFCLIFLLLVIGWFVGNVYQELDVLVERISFYESECEFLSDEYKLFFGERFENVVCDKLYCYCLFKGGWILEVLLVVE